MAEDLICALTLLFIFGMIWLRTRMHYTRQGRGLLQLQPAGRIYFAGVLAALVLGWLLAPPLAALVAPNTSVPPMLTRAIWYLAIYYLLIPAHRILKARGVEVFKVAA